MEDLNTLGIKRSTRKQETKILEVFRWKQPPERHMERRPAQRSPVLYHQIFNLMSQVLNAGRARRSYKRSLLPIDREKLKSFNDESLWQHGMHDVARGSTFLLEYGHRMRSEARKLRTLDQERVALED
ncbi:unnamed protein product, partial [Cuscuta epithymum]